MIFLLKKFTPKACHGVVDFSKDFFGKEAYGTVPLRGQGAVEPTVLRPGVKDKADPLGQRGYVGWKTWFTAVILNQVWMARLECGVTAL